MSTQVQSQPQVFTFEKTMGADVLRFEVTVQLLGVTPPQPAITCSLGTMPATSGESLWYITVNGPAGEHPVGYKSYVASATHAEVAMWSLPVHGCTPVE